MTTIPKWPNKAPGETLDYRLDWSARLNRRPTTDTITSSSWAATAGITISAQTYVGTTTTVWLSGGSLGDVYTLTNTIVTSGGRTMVQSVTIRIAAK